MKKISTILVLLLVTLSSYAQKLSIEGTVFFSDFQEPAIGAIVQVAGSDVTTMVDIYGNFAIDAEIGNTLIIRSTGYKTKEVEVKDKGTINVLLEPDFTAIEGVVVVGYGTQKRSLVTGSSTTIKSDDIARPGVVRVDEALQGKAAGVVVTTNGGQPGEGISIRIRGAGTNGDAAPLYVVDGIQLSNIDFLNPDDIASMEILKDAASAAIYGARGANGVIMITTKHGSYGESMNISANVSYGIQNLYNKMDMLDATSYMILQNEASINGGGSSIFSPEQIAKAGVGTDWQQEILNANAPIIDAQLRFTGGSENSRYSVSGSFFRQEGIIAPGKSDYERYTFRESTDSKYFDGALTFGQSLIFSASTKSGIDVNNTFGGPLLGSLNMDPVTSVYDENGDYAISPYVAQEIVNPVAQIQTVHASNEYVNIIGNTYLELKFLEDFKVKTNLSLDGGFGNTWGYKPEYYLNAAQINNETVVTNTSNRVFGLQWENTLSYDKVIEKHTIQAMVGNTLRQYNGSDIGASKSGLLIDDPKYAYLSLAKNEESASAWGGAWHNALVSYFGRVNYSYDDKYMLSATFRADGSSRFGTNNRFGYFPSVSAGWNISNESFMESVNWINSLKLRASWGQNGNENIGDWQYLSTIGTGARTYEYDGVIYPGASPDRAPNPDIKWETSEQFNVGVDAIVNSRFTFTLDYYIKTTKDLLVYVPIPSYVGVGAAASNAGSVRNSGVEFAFKYSDGVGDWNWSVDFNVAYNKNRVIEVGNAEGYIPGATVGTSMNSVTRMEEGLPISFFYGYQTDGIFQNDAEAEGYIDANGNRIQPDAVAGDFRYVDLNGDGQIDDNDRTMIGDPNPDFTGGLTLGAGWKGFDLSIFFSGMYGNDIFNATRRWDQTMSNYQISAADRWHGEGTSYTHPRLTSNDTNKNYSRASSFFIEDGSFLRLKNITLGYTFDLSKAKYISSVRLYASANNLLTFTNYSGFDPEIGNHGVLYNGIDYGMYPQPQTIIMGINITF